MTGRISTARARKELAGVVNRSARGERIKLTRYGRTLAVLIPKRDLEALEDCEKTRAAPARAGGRLSAQR
jgi:prevent-host-death family protein